MSAATLSTRPFRRSGLRASYIPRHPNLVPAFTSSPLVQVTRSPIDSAPIRLLKTPPPPPPMAWTWQCHLCHRSYRLGVIRRCLDDGHTFCAGEADACTTSLTRRWGSTPPKGSRRLAKRQKRHKPCGSEFDYAAWRALGDWRRDELGMRRVLEVAGVYDAGDETERSCEKDCNYPSECRWNKALERQWASETLAHPAMTAPTTFEEILGFNVAGIDTDRLGRGSVLGTIAEDIEMIG